MNEHLKQHLESFLFHSNEEVEVAVGGSLRMQERGFYRALAFAHHSNPTTPKLQHTSNQEQYDQCGNSTE